MSEFSESPVPDDLRALAERLAAQEPEVSELELDRVKVRAMKRATIPAAGSGGGAMGARARRLVGPVLAIGILLCGTGAVLALSGQFSSKQSAAQKEYGPGHGCGNRKHHKGKKRPPCKHKCPHSHKKHCTTSGTSGNDYIHGTGRPDNIHAGSGNDFIDVRHGGHDVVHCGGGRDVVWADSTDTVSRDCEIVHRVGAPKKKPKHAAAGARTGPASGRKNA
jgi:hypothetical protein